MSLVGRLEDLGLSDIFQILSVGRKTGTLIIKGSRGSVMIVFKSGLVVRAESDVIDTTIGDDLFKHGHIKKTTLQMAMELKKQLPKKSIADILYELGAVKKEILEKSSKKRIEKLVYNVLLWQDGDFQFELDDIDVDGKVDVHDAGWEMSKGLSPEYLLMEGARVYDEASQRISIIPEKEVSDEEEDEGQWGTDWAEPSTASRRDISSLKALSQELRFPNSTSEITLLVLRFASDMFQRGVLFMVRDLEIVGLGQFGLDMEGADEKIRETRMSSKDCAFISKIIRECRSYKGALEKDKCTDFLIRELGCDWPSEAAIFPLVAEGRTAAFLYCDNLPSHDAMPETEGLEIFISHAGLALEKAILQRKLQELEKRNSKS